jgi:hypothetical protein
MTTTQASDYVSGLGLIGALCWYWQNTDGSGRVLGVLKAIVWPAFLVYEAFKALAEGSHSTRHAP